MSAAVTWYHDSPVGPLRLEADGDHLTVLYFENEPVPPDVPDANRAHPVIAAACAQLDEYFAARRRTFELPLRPRGTDFQQKVWAALTRIPYGATASYGSIARTILAPDAVRAVGAANGANPIAIVIPCHRVIGSNGSLTGFGGGLPRKRFLLALEQGGDLTLAL